MKFVICAWAACHAAWLLDQFDRSQQPCRFPALLGLQAPWLLGLALRRSPSIPVGAWGIAGAAAIENL
jgi:hypothetical protein